MATRKTNNTIADKAALHAETAIREGMVEAYRSANGHGHSIVTHLQTIVGEHFADTVPEAVAAAIIDGVAVDLGWTEAEGKSTLHNRKSEARAVLGAVHALPQATAAFLALNDGKCTWHNSVSLARKIVKGTEPKAAAKELAEAQKKKAPEELTPNQAREAFGKALKRALDKLKPYDSDLAKAFAMKAIEEDLSL